MSAQQACGGAQVDPLPRPTHPPFSERVGDRCADGGLEDLETFGSEDLVEAADELYERLNSVHIVIFAVFTEGYAATERPDFVRVDLVDEATRLAELVCGLLPDEAESLGLLALLLLHDARRPSRVDNDGSLVLLEIRTARPGITSSSNVAMRSPSAPAPWDVPDRFS